MCLHSMHVSIGQMLYTIFCAEVCVLYSLHFEGLSCILLYTVCKGLPAITMDTPSFGFQCTSDMMNYS